MQDIATFLMFEGKAQEAMNFYVSLFDNSSIKEVTYYSSEFPDQEGLVMFARFTLSGKDFICIDSTIKHEFSFTPAISLFINCADGDEIDRLYHILSKDGEILMPLDHYQFSKKYGWVNDKYGVSWQLNLK